MRKIVSLLGIMTVSSILAFAEDWQGRLVDGPCYQQQKSPTACDPSNSSTSFILYVSGQAYALDAAGNAKATEALKARADRTTDPTKPPSSQVMAKVSGTKDASNNLKVDIIELQ